ncbi:MAG TPA: gluconate 2-dehydrogenase subunit 3 family protein [Chitinophagaceae bacterium]|nr:gluconate 2-dehydrogenase subunit 3 family protein [Chitinophagaceae bacterium]
MNRRKALRTLAIVSGGVITLPHWVISCGLSDSTVHHTSFSMMEQNILASVTDTIIPAGNSIGALSVGVDKFLQKLIDDCYQKEIGDNVRTQLKSLDQSAKTAHKKSFTGCTQKQRETLLLKLAASVNKSEKDFFDLVKSETIRGFNTSQKVMTEYLGYKVVPGHYYGCVDLNSPNHA